MRISAPWWRSHRRISLAPAVRAERRRSASPQRRSNARQFVHEQGEQVQAEQRAPAGRWWKSLHTSSLPKIRAKHSHVKKSQHGEPGRAFKAGDLRVQPFASCRRHDNESPQVNPTEQTPRTPPAARGLFATRRGLLSTNTTAAPILSNPLSFTAEARTGGANAGAGEPRIADRAVGADHGKARGYEPDPADGQTGVATAGTPVQSRSRRIREGGEPGTAAAPGSALAETPRGSSDRDRAARNGSAHAGEPECHRERVHDLPVAAGVRERVSAGGDVRVHAAPRRSGTACFAPRANRAATRHEKLSDAA